MRILDVREKTVSIASSIANAYVDFSKMTTSVVAVVTDVIRDGRRVVGYGFNSNGRYGQGALLRERFIPRLMAAAPESLIDAAHDNLDPFAHLGGDDEQREARRSRRSLGRGRHHRHGGVGRGREDRGQAALPRARRALSRRQGRRQGLGLCRRRLLPAGQGPVGAQGRDARAIAIAAIASSR